MSNVTYQILKHIATLSGSEGELTKQFDKLEWQTSHR